LKDIREGKGKQAELVEEASTYGVEISLYEQSLKVLFEDKGQNEQKFKINITKFKSEVESVISLLTAENDRLTELRDSMQDQVDTLHSRVQSSENV
jgi:hypothetical protein